MKQPLLMAGTALVLTAVLAVAVPLGMWLLGISLSIHGYIAVFLTVFFCFVMAGALMFLIFYSAHAGFDDAAHGGGAPPPADDSETR